MKVTVDHSWHDKPTDRIGGRWVLGLHIVIGGIMDLGFYLTVPEMKGVLCGLKYQDKTLVKEPGRHSNKAWWAYECVDGEDMDNVHYIFADADTEDVPLCLYRDDHMMVYLPHEIGDEIVEIIEQQLAQIGEDFDVETDTKG